MLAQDLRDTKICDKLLKGTFYLHSNVLNYEEEQI